MKPIVAIAAAEVVSIAATLVQWNWTGLLFGGLTESEYVQEYARRIAGVPLVIGDWEGTDHAPGDERERVIAGSAGEISRTYRNMRTNEVVNVFLIAGNHRSIAQHLPTQCYPAAGFNQLMDEQHYELDVKSDPPKANFYTTVFQKEKTDGVEMKRVFWTWSSDGTWLAPDSPRWTFMGAPALYKMYLISDNRQTSEDGPRSDACMRFAEELMPQLNAVLFDKSKEASSAVEDTSGESPKGGIDAGQSGGDSQP